ncbi:MAG TPA: tRNA (adenosine(37)-N6)-threonylcarbamoyltransferase complex dimerization subunit type 1 TsaB [Acidobacteriaceae bacterium]
MIDTCGAEGSVAIADGGGVVASASLPGRSASEKLVGAVRQLAERSGIVLRDLSAVAVVNGPGSFTGVRVGLSAAKGLCEALGVPLIAISRLQVLALGANAVEDIPVFAVLDARRGEFYCGEYADGAKLREALVTRDELAAWIGGAAAGRELMVCEAGVAQALAEFQPQQVAEPDALAALPLAMRRMERGEFDDVASIDANYLRRTDLEIFAKVKAAAAALAPHPERRS